ncbi:signal peptidase I [Patescibacteria group bacterium]|nr:signal peptidase I [Patescibacteria group bacterium]
MKTIKQILFSFWETLKIVILALAIALPIRYFIFQPFVVQGASMEPNFQQGNYLIVDEISYRFHSPQRGEVIVFKYPQNPSVKFIKRVIGLPGEKIKFENNKIIVINQQGESIVLNEKNYLEELIFLTDKEFIVPKGQYFVLGDNRLHSYDSKNWGAVPKDNIIGKVFLRLFPIAKISDFPVPAY